VYECGTLFGASGMLKRILPIVPIPLNGLSCFILVLRNPPKKWALRSAFWKDGSQGSLKVMDKSPCSAEGALDQREVLDQGEAVDK